jgi:serine/threonine protein kinase
MELLDASLVDVPPDSTNLDRGKMYVQMIDALESLHELGHLHRDVKPEVRLSVMRGCL